MSGFSWAICAGQQLGAPFEVARLKLGEREIHGGRYRYGQLPRERRDDVRLVRPVIHVLGHDRDGRIPVVAVRGRPTGHGKAEKREG